jgi:hypothetical protein
VIKPLGPMHSVGPPAEHVPDKVIAQNVVARGNPPNPRGDSLPRARPRCQRQRRRYHADRWVMVLRG